MYICNMEQKPKTVKNLAPYLGGALSKRQKYLRVNGRRVHFNPGDTLPSMVNDLFKFNLA